MSTEYLKLALDIIILIGLGGFIYYALQLSKALSVFRTYRSDFEEVMGQLTKHIDEAQNAIEDLKETSASSGADLRKMVKDAQFLTDDLQFMTENGNKLAERLEKSRSSAQNVSDDDFEASGNVSTLAKHRGSPDDEGFAIQDRAIQDDNEALDELSSEAERELYKAIKNAEGKK